MEKAFMSEKSIKYIRDKRINQVVTEAVNEVIKNSPPNPWLTFIKTFEKNMSCELYLSKITSKVNLSRDFKQILTVHFESVFKTQKTQFSVEIFGTEGQENLESSDFAKDFFTPIDFNTKQEKFIERMNEFNTVFEKVFCQKEIYSIANWIEILKELKKNHSNVFNVFGQSIFWLHFALLKKFEELRFDNYFQGLPIQPKTTPNKSRTIFYLMISNEGAHKSSKNVYFSFTGLANLEMFKAAFEFFQLVKSELESNKTFAGKITQISGCLVNPFESFAETIKFLLDTQAKFTKKDQVRFIIDVNAEENFDVETSKFNIDSAKKPMSDEEFEDYLVRLFGERKMSCTLIDPFPLKIGLSWHRFNKKIKEKTCPILFATKFYEKVDFDTFSKIEAEKYPTIKPDIMAKIVESVVVLEENWFRMKEFDTPLDLLEKLNLQNQAHSIQTVVLGPIHQNSLMQYNFQFMELIGTSIVCSPKDVDTFALLVNQNFYNSNK